MCAVSLSDRPVAVWVGELVFARAADPRSPSRAAANEDIRIRKEDDINKTAKLATGAFREKVRVPSKNHS